MSASRKDADNAAKDADKKKKTGSSWLPATLFGVSGIAYYFATRNNDDAPAKKPK